LQEDIFSGGERSDIFTFYYAFEYLKRARPRLMFISFDETDSYAHGGHYDQYLKSANKTDMLLQKLWNWLQSDSSYQNKTTLIITTDHGRGSLRVPSWKSHGRHLPGSNQMWFAVIGPDTSPTGEIKIAGNYYQNQMAATLAKILGLNYSNNKSVGKIISSMITPSPWSVEATHEAVTKK
jgi:phosphopentomutase